MSDIEYSVITSDVIKSFDCTLLTFYTENFDTLKFGTLANDGMPQNKTINLR